MVSDSRLIKMIFFILFSHSSVLIHSLLALVDSSAIPDHRRVSCVQLDISPSRVWIAYSALLAVPHSREALCALHGKRVDSEKYNFLLFSHSSIFLIHFFTALVDSSAIPGHRRVSCVLRDWQSYRRVCPCRRLLERVQPIKTPSWLHF